MHWGKNVNNAFQIHGKVQADGRNNSAVSQAGTCTDAHAPLTTFICVFNFDISQDKMIFHS